MFFLSLFFLLTSCSSQLHYDSSDAQIEADRPCATLKDFVVCDFPAIDPQGDDAKLSDLRGKPVVIDLSAMWCPPCIEAGNSISATAEQFPQVTFLTVLIENTTGQPPSALDLNDWKLARDIEASPVWGSSREIISSDPTDLENHFYLDGWPTFYFVNSDGVLVEYMRGFSETALIEKALALD